jgi:two-component system phosphate regulon sensor histidine kinase PhoR
LRARLRHPLQASFLGVLVVLVAFLMFAVGNLLRGTQREVARVELTRELRLAAELLANSASLPPDSIVQLIRSHLGYRVSLLGPDGSLISDSGPAGPETALGTLANLANLPEVAEARRTGIGLVERESQTGGRVLFGAVRSQLAGRPVVLRLAAPLTGLEERVRQGQRAVVIAGAFAAVLALLVTHLLSRAVTPPLVALRDRAGAIAAGDFSRRAPRNLPIAELDELDIALDRLAEQLDTRLAELGREKDEMQALIDTMAEGVVALTADARVLRLNRAAREFLDVPSPQQLAPVGTLVRQPEVRTLLEESVVRPVQARELRIGERHFLASSRLLERGGSVTTLLDVSEIRRLEQVRRDFVANVSHELKTPLTSIRGFAETLLEDEPPEPLRRQFLEMVRKNTLRLQRLVDDLLDLSRLEAGSWRVEAKPLDVALMAREAWQPFDPSAQEKGVAFEVDGNAMAIGDDQGLSQIFQNLFENALRYTPAGGRIRVSVRKDDGVARVEVSDTGSGIPARSLPRIFERFYRVDPARSREAGGTGLGLAIVRHLVQSMGGEVSAESELGRGTTMGFTLPLAG